MDRKGSAETVKAFTWSAASESSSQQHKLKHPSRSRCSLLLSSLVCTRLCGLCASTTHKQPAKPDQHTPITHLHRSHQRHSIVDPAL